MRQDDRRCRSFTVAPRGPMMRPMCALSQGNASVSIAASFAVVAGGYWRHAAFHVAAVGWDNDDDDAIADCCRA